MSAPAPRPDAPADRAGASPPSASTREPSAASRGTTTGAPIAFNDFSDLWFRTFLDTVDPTATAAELAFLERVLPLPAHVRVIDVCCGAGRHAVPLARRGYVVTGVDRDAKALDRARAAVGLAVDPSLGLRATTATASSATFIQADVRALPSFARPFDAAIVMWASFGYFAADENIALLASIRQRLRPRGRLILDVYNRDFFITRLGPRRVARGGVDVTETKRLEADRLEIELRYDGHDTADRFSWQIWDPAGLTEAVTGAGFDPVALCSGFDELQPPSGDAGRMQIVMQSRVA